MYKCIIVEHVHVHYSLLFLSLLSRLALPVCLNYLYIIQVVKLEHHEEDDQIPTTAFAEVSHALTTPPMTTPIPGNRQYTADTLADQLCLLDVPSVDITGLHSNIVFIGQ